MPRRCAGCGAAGDLVCPLCALDLREAMTLDPFRSAPDPPPAGYPPTWSSAPYTGALSHLLAAYKDDDRIDLRSLLSAWWQRSLGTALQQDEVLRVAIATGRPTYVVCAPSSAAARRRRGRDPLRDLVGPVVARQPGLQLVDAVGFGRRVRDQSQLGSRERAANLTGAVRLRAATRHPVRPGSCWIVADDVVTTGATLTEVARVLRAAGAGQVVAATIAATPRRAGGPVTSPGSR